MTLRGQLPRVLIATLFVAFVPLLIVASAEALTGVHSPLLAIAAIVALSFLAASAGAAYWSRRPGSRDLVFGDLMIWGWIRRLRSERRLARTAELLAVGRSGASALETKLSPERQTKLLAELASALEARDPHTHGHSRRVMRHAEMIAKRMGLTPGQVAMIRTAAAVHDAGKVDTPREVLNKPGKLNDEEFEVIKRHPVDGSRMVAGLGDPQMTAIVRHHHERLDGRGYPDRMAGEEIPLGARIIAVADTFDAITSSRPYRRALSHKKAIEILKSESGKQLDPAAVDAFLSYYSGRKSTSRWMIGISTPERALAGLRETVQASAAAPLANNFAAVAVTAVLGASLATPVAGAMENNLSSKRGETAAAEATPASSPAAAGDPRVAAAAAARAGSHESGSARAAKVTGTDGLERALEGGSVDPPPESSSENAGDGRAVDVGRPESPGRSDSAPGRNKEPKADKDQGADPPGQEKKPKESKPASPGDGGSTPPGHSDAPDEAGNGNGNGATSPPGNQGVGKKDGKEKA